MSDEGLSLSGFYVLHAEDFPSDAENFQDILQDMVAGQFEQTMKMKTIPIETVAQAREVTAQLNQKSSADMLYLFTTPYLAVAQGLIETTRFDAIVTDWHLKQPPDSLFHLLGPDGSKIAQLATNREFQPYAKVVIASDTISPSEEPPAGVPIMQKIDGFRYARDIIAEQLTEFLSG